MADHRVVRLDERRPLTGPLKGVAQQPHDAGDVVGISRKDQPAHSGEIATSFVDDVVLRQFPRDPVDVLGDGQQLTGHEQEFPPTLGVQPESRVLLDRLVENLAVQLRTVRWLGHHSLTAASTEVRA
ncbi:hypothetical protein ACFFSW_05635 [Saccharothrix longispora]|uniref:Uncharacterized protein n=1 Tax=Saccharothrix longispora TaxID=33920 RepID=A0ABU1PYB2_9PSEU|nr:hypothetical protein [Saccharothrix longispora]MDR6595640.1 hypothetical protein [Saccharothrix longispora]